MSLDRTNEDEETRRNGETEIVQQHTGVEYAACLEPIPARFQYSTARVSHSCECMRRTSDGLGASVRVLEPISGIVEPEPLPQTIPVTVYFRELIHRERGGYTDDVEVFWWSRSIDSTLTLRLTPGNRDGQSTVTTNSNRRHRARFRWNQKAPEGGLHPIQAAVMLIEGGLSGRARAEAYV